jgi:hypothetical protein
MASDEKMMSQVSKGEESARDKKGFPCDTYRGYKNFSCNSDIMSFTCFRKRILIVFLFFLI